MKSVLLAFAVLFGLLASLTVQVDAHQSFTAPAIENTPVDLGADSPFLEEEQPHACPCGQDNCQCYKCNCLFAHITRYRFRTRERIVVHQGPNYRV